ncbi:MAG: hypothetical protein HOK20_05955 [Alphaproteobacteria bacterium]|nr:hypothetical protein [Alphaproteobacteria bacterium]
MASPKKSAGIPQKKSRRGWFWWVLFIVVLGFVGVYGFQKRETLTSIFSGEKYSQLSENQKLLEKRLDRLEAMIQSFGSEKREVSSIAGDNLHLQTELSAFNTRIGIIESKLSDLETRGNVVGVKSHEVVGLRNQDKVFASKLSTLEMHISALEKEAEMRRVAVKKIPQIFQDLLSLKRAILSGTPFKKELAVLKKTLGKDSSILPLADALSKDAASGVPSVAHLVEMFPNVVNQILKESKSEEVGVLAKLEDFLRDLVIIRKTSSSLNEEDKSSLEAVLSLAESRLKLGDLYGALNTLDRLPVDTSEALMKWLEMARARVKTEEGLMAIESIILIEVTSVKGRL